MIADLEQSQQVFWAVNAATSVILLVLLAARKNYRTYPAFTFYVFINLAAGVSLFFIYRQWGYSAGSSWVVAWGMQAVVLCARALAVAEICRHFLSRYVGIWALAKRILLVSAGVVFLYSGLAARRQWESLVPSADRALELAVAAVIVLLFLFARYYEVPVGRTDHSLAVGFCLYSCFRALNDTILEQYLYGYDAFWSLLGSLAFFSSLCLWSWALRKSRSEIAAKENPLPFGVYQLFAPKINVRLRSLNDELWKVLKPEVTRH